jgi:hypothetical protein
MAPSSSNSMGFAGYVAVCVQLYCRCFTLLHLVVAVLHYMFRPTWPWWPCSVLSWCQAHISEPRPIFFRQLLICDVERPLWRKGGSVVFSCFFFLFDIASAAFLSSKSHRPDEHILLLLFLRLPQPGGPRSCMYFPQERDSPVISPHIDII